MPIGLEKRRKALEEVFFREADRRLLEELRATKDAEQGAVALGHASGLRDTEVLRPLVAHGIRAETLPALLLVPLVAVAWADDTLTRNERLEILARASELGIEPDSASSGLLTHWLEARPPDALLEAWLAYARALAEALDPRQCAEVELGVLRRAREVARASGGVLRLGQRIAASEQEVLDRLAEAFCTQ